MTLQLTRLPLPAPHPGRGGWSWVPREGIAHRVSSAMLRRLWAWSERGCPLGCTPVANRGNEG
jgi:hypothetical protein